jgi:hypothetical protein
MSATQPKKIRWRSMKSTPKKPGVVWIKGKRKHYPAYFDGATIISTIPGWETYLGWRKTEPPNP